MKEPKDTLDILIGELDKQQPKHSIWYYFLDGKLVKQKKPCIAGDVVHIKRWDGAYRVLEATVGGFQVRKNGECVTLPWSEFRCNYGKGKSITAEFKRELRSIVHHNYDILATATRSQALADRMIRQLRDCYKP